MKLWKFKHNNCQEFPWWVSWGTAPHQPKTISPPKTTTPFENQKFLTNPLIEQSLSPENEDFLTSPSFSWFSKFCIRHFHLKTFMAPIYGWVSTVSRL